MTTSSPACAISSRSFTRPARSPESGWSAALLSSSFDRRTTGDLDSLHIEPGSDEAVLSAAGRVAERRGWAAGWFNFAVEHADSVPTLDEAEQLYEAFYPGDALTDRAVDVVERIIAGGLPATVLSPGPINL